MSDTTIRIRRQRPFTMIDNQMVSDQRLSIAALGLAVRLFSLSPEYDYSAKYIRNLADVGRDKFYQLLKELKECGYLQQDQNRGDHGHFGRNSLVLVDIPGNPPCTAQPYTVEPHTANPDTVNDNTNPRKKNKLNNNTPPVSPKDVTARFSDYAAGDEELLAALSGLAEKRAAAKNPINTPRMVSLLLSRLDKLSGGDRMIKIAMLDKAVTHNWATVYALNDRDLEDLARERAPEPRGGEEAFGVWH